MGISKLEYTTLLRSNPDLTGPQLPRMKRGQGKAPTEQQEQEAVMAWADENKGRWPALEWLFHVPNGGYRNEWTAVQMRRAGLKAGVPDLLLPVSKLREDGGTYHGLAIELKRRDHSNAPTAEQKVWLDGLRRNGWLALVAYGADEAIHALEHYLGGAHGK